MICTSPTVRLVNHCFTTRTSRTNRTGRAKKLKEYAIIRVVSVRVYFYLDEIIFPAAKTHEDEIKTRVAKVNVYTTVLVAHLLREL